MVKERNTETAGAISLLHEQGRHRQKDAFKWFIDKTQMCVADEGWP